MPGRPDFQGPVGRFDLTAKVDRTHVAAGEAVTLRCGSPGPATCVRRPSRPRLEVPGVRLYPPSTKTDPTHLGHTQTTHRVELRLVPTAKGALTIPPSRSRSSIRSEKRVVTKTTHADRARGRGRRAPGADRRVRTPPSAGCGRDDASAERRPLRRRPRRLPTPALAAVDLTHGTVTLPLWALAAVPGPRSPAPGRSSSHAGGGGATPSGTRSLPRPTRRRSGRPRGSTARCARRSPAATDCPTRSGPPSSSALAEGPRRAGGPPRRREGPPRRRRVPPLRAPARGIRRARSASCARAPRASCRASAEASGRPPRRERKIRQS